MKTTAVTTVIAVILIAFAPGCASAQCHGGHQDHGDHAQGGQDHDRDMESTHGNDACMIHGGGVAATRHHRFECVFHESGVRVYAYNGKQEPILDPEKTGGSVEFIPKEGNRVKVPLKYVGPDKKIGRTQGYLSCEFDLSGVKDGMMEAEFSIHGLPHEKERSASFRRTVKRSPLTTYVCPMGCEGGTAPDPGSCRTCGMSLKRRVEGDRKQGAGHGGHEHGGGGCGDH